MLQDHLTVDFQKTNKNIVQVVQFKTGSKCDYLWAGKDSLNRNVFNSRRNSGSDVAFQSCVGREFHVVATTAGNEWLPSVEQCVLNKCRNVVQ